MLTVGTHMGSVSQSADADSVLVRCPPTCDLSGYCSLPRLKKAQLVQMEHFTRSPYGRQPQESSFLPSPLLSFQLPLLAVNHHFLAAINKDTYCPAPWILEREHSLQGGFRSPACLPPFLNVTHIPAPRP